MLNEVIETMSKIKVYAGDLKECTWKFSFRSLKMSRIQKGFLWNRTISISFKKDIEDIEQLTEEKVKKISGTLGWGVAGGVLLGPLGAIGGMFVGGNKKEVAFACYLKDGRKFMATTDGKTWQKIMSATF